MRHQHPSVLNVPYTAGSGPKKLSIYIYDIDYTDTLEILCIGDISRAELLLCSEPSWLPTTREESAIGFKYTYWNEVGETMDVF